MMFYVCCHLKIAWLVLTAFTFATFTLVCFQDLITWAGQTENKYAYEHAKKQNNAIRFPHVSELLLKIIMLFRQGILNYLSLCRFLLLIHVIIPFWIKRIFPYQSLLYWKGNFLACVQIMSISLHMPSRC